MPGSVHYDQLQVTREAQAGGGSGRTYRQGEMPVVVRNVAPRRRHIRLAIRLSGGALLGKLFGFLRELCFARLLGVSFIADSYRGAVTATLLPIAALQGDIVPSVLIPLHREWNAAGRGSELFTPLIAMFGAISCLLAVLTWMFAGLWVDFLLPGFEAAAHTTTVAMVRIMALSMPASVMNACMSCLEISVGRSRITTLRATVQNLGIIAGIFVLALTGRPVALAVGFTISFWVLLLIGGYLLWREREFQFHHVRWRAGLRALQIFIVRMRALFLQPIGGQANIMIERLAGSQLGTGAIAALDYARTLTETAQYLVSQPIGYVVLTQGATNPEQVKVDVASLAKPLLALALPTSLYIVLMAPQIVHVIYARGAFQSHGVMLTAAALRGIGCGLWAATLGYILLRMLNAAGRNGAAARVSIAGFLVNSLINLTVTRTIGVMGLGLGEAAGGLTILTCTSLLLGCGTLILHLTLKLVPALLLLVIAVLAVERLHLASFPTLALGAQALAIVALSGVRPQLRSLLRRVGPQRARAM